MAKADGLPLRHQFGGARCDLMQQRGVALSTYFVIECGEMRAHHMVGQSSEFIHLSVGSEVLKMAKTNKARGHPSHHGCGFCLFAVHQGRRTRDAQSAGSWNAQAVHRLAGQKFPNAGPQHGAAITSA